MGSQWWMDDEQLLAELSAALASTTGVPRQVLDIGRAAYAWRTIDDELAQLTYDSDLDDELLAHTRSSVTTRTLVFDSPELAIEIELVGSVLVGQLVPPQPGTVEVVSLSGTNPDTTADDIGRFVLPDMPRGPVRLRCRKSDGSHVVTDWLRFTDPDGVP